MKDKPILRVEAITMLTTIAAGIIALIYTFSTTFATNSRVDRQDDLVKLDLRDFRVEIINRFDRLESKIDTIKLQK